MPNFTKSKGFQLKSGNTANAPFKLMGSSPVKHDTGSQHMHSKGGSGSYRKDPEDDNKLKQTGVGGDIDKKDHIKGNRFDTKENQEEVKKEKEGKKGKEGTWLGRQWKKFQAHHDSGEAKKVEAEFADLAEMLDPGKKGLAAGIREGIEKKNTIKKSEVFAADAETRAQEMHESTLARNESLTKRTNQLAALDASQKNNTIDSESEFAVEEGEGGESKANMDGEIT